MFDGCAKRIQGRLHHGLVVLEHVFGSLEQKPGNVDDGQVVNVAERDAGRRLVQVVVEGETERVVDGREVWQSEQAWQRRKA